MSITKQRSTAGKSVAIFFLVFIILEALIVAGVSIIFKNKDSTPGLMGYSMFIMDSDKMGDHVPQGSLVIAEDGCPSLEGIKKAVIAHDVPGVGTSVFWLANVSTSQDLQGVVYTVYQDKVPGKLYQLKASNIIGVASSYYKTAGAVVRFMTSNFGRIVLIVTPLFFLVLIEVIILIVNRLRYTEYEDDEDEYDDEPKNSVELDDFLFGGKNNKEKIANSVQSGAEVAEEFVAGERQPRRRRTTANGSDARPERSSSHGADRSGRKPRPDNANESSDEKRAPRPERTAADKKASADKAKDSSNYDKAPKPVDKENEADESSKRDIADDDIAFTKKPKDISASLEDLMKQMEMESNKLKDQLADKKTDNK